VSLVLLSSPSESRGTAGCNGSRRATPMKFAWNGLGSSAGDCSSVLAPRCAALRLVGLPRILPGLTPDSACAGPGRTFEASALRRRSTGIAASGSLTHSSALLRSTLLLPGPAHAGLLSWGWTGRPGFPERLTRRPSIGFAPSREGPLRVYSRNRA